jgi:hypothetical protein
MSKKKSNIAKQISENLENTKKNPALADIEEPPSIPQSSKPENMDIHAHHFHKAPGKKFWHYFFEFLMLFLAVTLGFFVENQREKYIENQRAEEYAQSLYDDLKIDTAVIQRTLDEKAWIYAKYDSALKITVVR